jgi:hypothetical protein
VGRRCSPRLAAQKNDVDASGTTADKKKTLNFLSDEKTPEEKQGYIYLIREREFVRLGESVYKIGRSKNFEKRFESYPKNSEILCCTFTKDQFRAERTLIHLFDSLFTQRSDFGREYFEGNRAKMIQEFLALSIRIHEEYK